MIPETVIARTLDNRGGDCATGFVKLLEAMETIQPGEILEVISTDPASQNELRDWAARSGNTIAEKFIAGPMWRREFRYLIQKGGVAGQ